MNTRPCGHRVASRSEQAPAPDPVRNSHKNAKDTRTEAQKRSLRALLVELKQSYPRALIMGHNVFANKACPCFDAAKEYADLQPK